MKEIGQTKDSGFQIGVRKTFKLDSSLVWDFLLSEKGFKIWLGEFSFKEFKVGYEGVTKEGISFKITTLKDNSHIRLKWQKGKWIKPSILQLRVIPDTNKTTISFHQEKLLNSTVRQDMKKYWMEKMAELKKYLNNLNIDLNMKD